MIVKWISLGELLITWCGDWKYFQDFYWRFSLIGSWCAVCCPPFYHLINFLVLSVRANMTFLTGHQHQSPERRIGASLCMSWTLCTSYYLSQQIQTFLSWLLIFIRVRVTEASLGDTSDCPVEMWVDYDGRALLQTGGGWRRGCGIRYLRLGQWSDSDSQSPVCRLLRAVVSVNMNISSR